MVGLDNAQRAVQGSFNSAQRKVHQIGSIVDLAKPGYIQAAPISRHLYICYGVKPMNIPRGRKWLKPPAAHGCISSWILKGKRAPWFLIFPRGFA